MSDQFEPNNTPVPEDNDLQSPLPEETPKDIIQEEASQDVIPEEAPQEDVQAEPQAEEPQQEPETDAPQEPQAEEDPFFSGVQETEFEEPEATSFPLEENEPSFPQKKKGAGGAIVAVVIVLLIVAIGVAAYCFGLLDGLFFKSSDMGTGNTSNMSFVTKIGDYTYYVEPTTYAICRYKKNLNDAQMMTAKPDENPAVFLTNVGGELYYVSLLNGSMKKYVDGTNDETIVEGQCYFPYFRNNTLYYLGLSDFRVYAAPLVDGVLGEFAPVLDANVYLYTIDDNNIYYICADDNVLYSAPLAGGADPVAIETGNVTTFCVGGGSLYYMMRAEDTADSSEENDASAENVAETAVTGIYRVSLSDYNQKENVVPNVYAAYLNYVAGKLYYLDYTKAFESQGGEPTEGSNFRLCYLPTRGNHTPVQVNNVQSMYVQIAGGYVYYLTTIDNQTAFWKRLPIGATDMDGTASESMMGSELLPLTDEPFALEDMLGEENTESDKIQASPEDAETEDAE